MKKFLLAIMIMPLFAAESAEETEYVTLTYIYSRVPIMGKLIGKLLFPPYQVKIPRAEWEQEQKKYEQWIAQHPVINTAVLATETLILMSPLLFALLALLESQKK